MTEAIKFPKKRVYPRIVGAKEMWAQDEPPDEMVWAICPQLRCAGNTDDYRCHQCTKWENDKDYGKVQRMCYGLAAETCRIVFAMQARLDATTGGIND